MKPKDIAENMELAQSILGQWLRYRQYYQKGISDEDVVPQDEAEFLETTSAIVRNTKRLAQRLDEKTFPFRKNELSALLKSTVSIQSFRTMPDSDRKKFYKDWHQTLVALTRTVGALKFLSEGYRPLEKKKKGKKKSPVVPIVAGIGAVLVVIVILKFLGVL